MKIYLFILSLFFCGISFAQSTISGTVTNSKNEPISGANVRLVGEKTATTTDFDGSFTLKSSIALPNLEVTMVGFATKIVRATAGKFTVVLQDEETKLNEIVVSASRTPERVLESPVTIERMTVRDIKKSGSPSFYDGLENMKEVQMNTSSLSFKSINTRGFATVANTRFMQLVDGMDNSSPLLNFVLGNLVGISEIDVQSVELLPGASSALYGANAFNGILFMTSKSPFTNEGITAYAKYGQTSQVSAGNNGFYDNGIRAAKMFSKHFAAKANFSILSGTDWWATDYNDKTVAGIDRTNPGYNGINVYGDEVSTNIRGVAKGLLDAGKITPSQFVAFNNILPNATVSRTGYNEVDLTDNKVKNTKADFSLHLRPFGNENLEVIWQSKFGFGNTVYQGANRYYLNNFFMQQHRLEFKGKNFFLRGYTTTEDGGRSYDMVFAGINVNRAAKEDKTWFGQYAASYVASTLAGQLPQGADAIARNYADNNIRPNPLTTGINLPDPTGTGLPRFVPGTPEFKKAFNRVIADPDVLTGSKLVDNSRIYHSDANYNFKQSLVKFAEIQVGGSFRLYELNSRGRIYTDKESQINYNEYGFYTQARTKLLEDRLKIAASLRYDKAKNFDGNVSPRVSLVYSAGANKNHNLRASFQTGFRNPTTQDQYIGFNIGNAVLVGSAPDNLLRYTETLDVSGAAGQFYNGGLTKTMNGLNAYNNSYTATSVLAFAAFAAANPGNTAGAAALLKVSNAKAVKPETVKAIELGYRTQVKDFTLDLNGYYNTYNNFIGNLTVVAPLYGTVSETFDFAQGATDTPVPYASNKSVQTLNALASGNTRNYQLYTNTNIEIKSLGFGAGISKKVYKDFEVGANYNYAQFDYDQAKDTDFEASFNTPKQRIKVSLGNEKLFKNFGFNISGRWNSAYKWESTFADGIIAEAKVLDAQINYTIPSLKSTFKIGAANIGGKEYRQVVGAGLIGQQYFASLTINP